MDKVQNVRKLNAYQQAFDSAMEIFEISRSFPAEEQQALAEDLRRSSRSICVHLSAGWRKRRYKVTFLKKLMDAQEGVAEIQTWLQFAHACRYISQEQFDKLDDQYEQIFMLLFTLERKANAVAKQGG